MEMMCADQLIVLYDRMMASDLIVLWLLWIIRFNQTEWCLYGTWRYHNCSYDRCLQTVHVSRYSDSLWPGRSGDWLPVGGRFLAPWGPPTYTMCTGSFPGVKQPGRGIDHPPLSSAEVKERVGLNLYSTLGPSWLVLGWALPFLFSFPRFQEIS